MNVQKVAIESQRENVKNKKQQQQMSSRHIKLNSMCPSAKFIAHSMCVRFQYDFLNVLPENKKKKSEKKTNENSM